MNGFVLGGANEVNFDEKKRQNIAERVSLKKFSKDMFDEAEKDIMNNLRFLLPYFLTLALLFLTSPFCFQKSEGFPSTQCGKKAHSLRMS